MYVVFEQSGFQFIGDKGTKLKIPRVEGSVGENILIDKVLLLKDGDKLDIGRPYINGIKLKAKIVAQGHEPTIIVYKYKRRKKYRRKKGHRQKYTEIEIKGISKGE